MTKIYNSKFGLAQVLEDTDTGHLRLVDPDTGQTISDSVVDRSIIVGDPIGYEYGDEGDLGLLREKPVEEDDLFDEMRRYMLKPRKGKTTNTHASKDVQISLSAITKSCHERSVSIRFRKNINGYFELNQPYTVYPKATIKRLYFWRQDVKGAGRCVFSKWSSSSYIGYFKGTLLEVQQLLPVPEKADEAWNGEFEIQWEERYGLPYIDLSEVKTDE